MILFRDSQMGVLKFPKLGLLRLWGPITLCVDLLLIWFLKKSCSLCLELFNGMSHVTCTQGNRGDSQLLMARSQTANLTPNLSFDHNLYFKCQNGSCKPILDIYVLRVFQWQKEIFNPMGFDPYNRSLKIQKSIRTPTPKVGVYLGVWGFIPSHSPTLPRAWDVTPGLPSWPASLQALVLVMSLRLKLEHIISYPFLYLFHHGCELEFKFTTMCTIWTWTQVACNVIMWTWTWVGCHVQKM